MMGSKARLLLVTGTGTGIGKTHATCALAAAWSRLARVAAVKPIESGVDGAEQSDAQRLDGCSSFHVKLPPPYALRRPVSPHLAARDEGLTLDTQRVRRWLDPIRDQADVVIVELAGGLFSPLGPGLTNAELAASLDSDGILVVAPDRLGTLHDLGALVRAAEALRERMLGVVFVAPQAADASTGTNVAELPLVCDVPVLGALPRASADALASSREIRVLLERVLARLEPRT
jgi:dethiobiotin synthetase